MQTAALNVASPEVLKATGRGVIVVSGVVVLQALWTTHPRLNITFASVKADGQPDLLNSISTDGHSDPAKPFVAEVAAGDYILAAFSYEAHGGKYNNVAGMLGIAPARFKIAAGEVLYLGHVKVIPETSIVIESKPKFNIALENYDAAARAYLASHHPATVQQLRHQPLAIAPQLLATR